MTSHQDNLTKTYFELSSLYKNPTRLLRGMAASNQDTKLEAELANKHQKLFELFKKKKWHGQAETSALYFKTLSLLYEVDDYRGVAPSVEELILTEHTALIDQFDPRLKRRKGGASQKIDFNDPEVRSLWKGKVLCCVAIIESRRKSMHSNALLSDLNLLEEFIETNLHNLDDDLPAWTTLAFVRAAQARVARQSQMYSYMREKLLSVVKCLDERVAEIIEKLSALQAPAEKTKEAEADIEKLVDDLVFIRRKQTLSTSFNVGLAELQRGSLRVAAYACQAAQLEFRLHGHLFHRLFNELIMLSIKRAQTSREHKNEFYKLKDILERDILPLLKPKGHAGNPKLYLYGLRELAVIQYYCGDTDEMLTTLKDMGNNVRSSSTQWNTRISNLRARAHWRRWVLTADHDKDTALLDNALADTEAAFQQASGLNDCIAGFIDTESLLTGIEGALRKNLPDTIESLITYADVQLGLHQPLEAIKSAAAVIELCEDDNPRLLAMGHLVMAEAHIETGLFIAANQHLAVAKTLERQIDHKYVEGRIRSIEKLESMREVLDLSDCKAKELIKAEDLLLGWFIQHRSDMSSINKVAEDLGVDRKKIRSYLTRLGRIENLRSPYYHLIKLKDKYQKKGKGRP